jgi:hypothetical protein
MLVFNHKCVDQDLQKAIGVFIGSLGLFWTNACVGGSVDSFLLYLFYYVLILYLLTRNAFNFVY